MTQQSLFAPRPVRPVSPVSRHNGPATSHAAAREVLASGTVHAGMRRALALVVAHEGWTSAELAGGDVRLRYELARRLPDAEKAGLVAKGAARVCRRTGRLATQWYPTPSGRDALCR